MCCEEALCRDGQERGRYMLDSATALYVRSDGHFLYMEVAMLDSRQQSRPGEELRHRDWEGEPIGEIVVTTRSALEFVSSTVQKAFI